MPEIVYDSFPLPVPQFLISVIVQKKHYQCWSEGIIDFTIYKGQAVQVSVTNGDLTHMGLYKQVKKGPVKKPFCIFQLKGS